MDIYQGVYFFGVTLNSFLLALTLGHLSRWFEPIGHTVGIIGIICAICLLFFAAMVRKSEVTALIFFGLFIVAFGGHLVWF